MSLTPSSNHLFQVDGLLVTVRCLVVQYKLDSDVGFIILRGGV